jgi:toxin secretion/phage lysis holin
MNKYINAILAVLSAAGGLAIHYLGGLDQLLMALLALIVVDYITGIAKAVAIKALDSKIGFKGIARKTLILSVVALSYVAESLTRGTLPLREMVILFFAANEGLSILENAAAAGLPIPEKLKETLAQLRGKENG